MGFFRTLIEVLAPYSVQKRMYIEKTREPLSEELDRLLRVVWNWRLSRQRLVLDDGWQSDDEGVEWRTLILQPTKGDWFHLRWCPSRRSVWADVRTLTCQVEFPTWVRERWLVDRVANLMKMLEQLPAGSSVIGMLGNE